MSFFGFDTTLPRDRGHPSQAAPGFGQAPDPFASVSRRNDDDDDDDAIDFEDTYDGLGDQLDETDDVFNDDTFGAVETGPTKTVGKDFDFFGNTAQVSNAINEEHVRYTLQHQPPKALVSQPIVEAKPARTGYEKYADTSYIPDLQADAALWGTAPKKSAPQPDFPQQYQSNQGAYSNIQAASRKMMSLEEVEAAMRAQSKKSPAAQEPFPVQTHPQSIPFESLEQPAHLYVPTGPSQRSPQNFSTGRDSMPQSAQYVDARPQVMSQAPIQILQRQQPKPQQQVPQMVPVAVQPQVAPQGPPTQPRKILQNPNRQQSAAQRGADASQLLQQLQQGPSVGPNSLRLQGQVPILPQQLPPMSELDRAAFLESEAKRAKRNHKIHLLSKDNGLMTPQDKNFITRIQLQQLVTATGNPNEGGTDAALAEDFYYQVLTQIRGGPRQNPQQPLSQFAQTYLIQTGGRQGATGGRRQLRGDTHLQRMEQQVQRAVEAAKLKPKNKQLVIEGSLGKISFSNAKTPKPLLNIKKPDHSESSSRVGDAKKQTLSSGDRKTVLRDIENVYGTLMLIEDHVRNEPSPAEDGDAGAIQQHMEWNQSLQAMNKKLWNDLKVEAPIIPNSSVPHPFVALLSYAKGKKVIPRIFRHITQDQRLMILTMIIVHLEVIDVVRNAHNQAGEHQLPTAVREEIELFSQAVMPCLFGYINEAALHIVIGEVNFLMQKCNVQQVARTKIGVSIMTMFISRAELVKEAGQANEAEWEQWAGLFNNLFDLLEPVLGHIFPGSVSAGEDIYVWQLLAAMGAGASPEQQQRLVLAVKDRVMETFQQSKTLPPDMATQRLSNINLFMRAIGLDVSLLG